MLKTKTLGSPEQGCILDLQAAAVTSLKTPHIGLCCTPVGISHVGTVFTCDAGLELEPASSVRRCRAAIGPTLTDELKELVLNHCLSILVTVTQTSMRTRVCVFHLSFPS